MRRLVLAALAGILAAACDSPSATPAATPVAWGGAQITQAVPIPDVSLTDTSGRPFRLRAATRGKVLLLYFGYTHCPDQCPADMATLANALKTLPAADRQRIVVAFVTTDPARDTGPVLRSFLDRFDHGFVGLTGTPAQIAAAERATGVTLATAYTLTPGPSQTAAPPGTYFVDHAAFVVAFSTDGLAHEVFPGGVPAKVEANDVGAMSEGHIPFT